MKKITLSLAVALGLLAAPALAQTADQLSDIDLSTLSQTQLDSLVKVLSGLPRG